MRIAFSWDDGAPEDLRLMDLHKKYEIPGMFFVPTENREGRNVLTREQIKASASEFVTFGGHTEHHTYLTSMPKSEVEQEIKANKEYLEDILGVPIRHFCLPGGKYDQEILDIVFRQFETCRTADTMAFSKKGNLLIPTFHFYPRGIKSLIGNAIKQKNVLLGRKALQNAGKSYFDLIRILTDEAVRVKDSQIIIWGHSWEIDELGLWGELEQYMSYVKQIYGKLIVSYNNLTD